MINKTEIVGFSIIIILLGILGLVLHRGFTVEQIDEMFVTSVKIDNVRLATWVYSYDKVLILQGSHYNIKLGQTYRFTYVWGVPYTRLINIELIQ